MHKDIQTCNISFHKKLFKVVGFLSAAFVTALILLSIAYRYFPSANEKLLLQENDRLRQQYMVLDERTRKMGQQLVELEKRDNEVYRVIFEANPIPDSARIKEQEQLKEMKILLSMQADELERSIITSVNTLSNRLAFMNRSLHEIIATFAYRNLSEGIQTSPVF